MKPTVWMIMIGTKTGFREKIDTNMATHPYTPKKTSNKMVFVNGKTYALSLQASSLVTTPNFGVRKNSLLPPNNASKTAMVLLTDIPAAKKIKNRYCLALSFHLSPQIFLIM